MAYELIAVGASWGGMRAVATILAELPDDFGIPIAVVQHRAAAGRDEMLEEVWDRHSPLPVLAPSDKEPLLPGHVYTAPADYHLIAEPGHLALSTEDLVQFARPSIDVLFESAAAAYGPRAVGVLLTGTGEDGVVGLGAIGAALGLTIAQDPAGAERGELPAAAIARGVVRRVLPLERIGPFLTGLRPALAGGGT